MKESNELFELCKQVYEATGWKDTLGYIQPFGKNVHFPNWFDDTITKDHDIVPLYTSDYLLEKLSAVTDHISVNRHNKISIDARNGEKGNWYAHYWFKSRRVQVKSDTPLKALLRLALKLHEDKIL